MKERKGSFLIELRYKLKTTGVKFQLLRCQLLRCQLLRCQLLRCQLLRCEFTFCCLVGQEGGISELFELTRFSHHTPLVLAYAEINACLGHSEKRERSEYIAGK